MLMWSSYRLQILQICLLIYYITELLQFIKHKALGYTESTTYLLRPDFSNLGYVIIVEVVLWSSVPRGHYGAFSHSVN